MYRRVHREWAVTLSGPRTLLMQAAHPVAFAGFFAHTGSLGDPYRRLERTAAVMNTIAFGERAAADRATRRVRLMHSRVRGVLAEPAGRFPAGTPYAADDPELLMWILGALADSALVVYDRYVATLSDEERDAYWQDARVVGGLFGLADDEMPRDIHAFDAYVDGMLASGDLWVGDLARDLAVDVVLRPPAPVAARPLVEAVNQITIALLPREIRTLYGFGWDPLRGAAVRGGAEYLKRLVLPLLPHRVRAVPASAS